MEENFITDISNSILRFQNKISLKMIGQRFALFHLQSPLYDPIIDSVKKMLHFITSSNIIFCINTSVLISNKRGFLTGTPSNLVTNSVTFNS